MMNEEVSLASSEEIPGLLVDLRLGGVKNAWAIQDLTLWPERSQLFFSQQSGQLSYVLVSGHPASHAHPTMIADGDPHVVSALLEEMRAKAPFVIRETPAHLLGVLRDHYPEAKIYPEQRMEVTRETFIPRHTSKARSLTEADAGELAQFFGATPLAADSFKGWLRGAKAFHGVFEGDRLVSIGSSMASVPEAWNLVSIETHQDFRGKGHATEVVSSLVARALKETSTVTVTVVKSNLAAIRTYEKLGFRFAQEMLWLDHGAGARP